jgi:hypothetical protein
MRTLADKSIFGISNIESSSENSNDKFIYGGGGETGQQLLISVADFCRLSAADIVDISSTDAVATEYPESIDLTSKASTDHSKKNEIVTSTKSRRERLTSQLSHADAEMHRATFMFQPSIRKNRVNEGNEKATSSMKSIRKERWLSAISSTGLPNFSAKLLRDYSMLADSNPFFEMLSLYDASPASFQAGLSR